MPRWENNVMSVARRSGLSPHRLFTQDKSFDGQTPLDVMNEMGAKGWEPYGIVANATGEAGGETTGWLIFFRRQVG